MILVRNKFSGLILGRQYKAMCLFPFLIVRPGYDIGIDIVTCNHELIHADQQKEMLFIFFYLWYGLEYLFRLCMYRDASMAYKNLLHEREAYLNEKDLLYRSRRKHFSFIKYLRHGKKA